MLCGYPKATLTLTPKVGGPVCNTAVEKPGHKPDTKHIDALPWRNSTILKDGSESERENKDTQRIDIV